MFFIELKKQSSGILCLLFCFRKSPGGVFLRLVKEIATEEQSEAIFKDEKERHSRRKKCARQKRLKERKQNSMDFSREYIKEELKDKNKQVI